MKFCLALALFSIVILASEAQEQCGRQAGGALCPGGLCCSQYGFCGNDSEYCSPSSGCQSQCSTSGDVSSIISQAVFDDMLKYRDDSRCHAPGFYTYDAFIAAAKSFGEFATTGDLDTRKREVAAFLGQTSHETTGGWDDAPDGRNYNYGQAGKALGYDLINNPDLVATDPTVSFKTAFWFWMTPQGAKPSCHDVITGKWSPSPSDTAAGRVPGYGLVTNVINGGVECGPQGEHDKEADRIGFYKRYCDIFGARTSSVPEIYAGHWQVRGATGLGFATCRLGKGAGLANQCGARLSVGAEWLDAAQTWLHWYEKGSVPFELNRAIARNVGRSPSGWAHRELGSSQYETMSKRGEDDSESTNAVGGHGVAPQAARHGIELLREDNASLKVEIGLLKKAVANGHAVPSGPGVGFKVPEPKAFGVTQNTKELENFLWDREEYFRVTDVPGGEKVAMTSVWQMMPVLAEKELSLGLHGNP
nr:chitinase 3-like [Ipomoea batatas]